jgi:hypothetical protein
MKMLRYSIIIFVLSSSIMAQEINLLDWENRVAIHYDSGIRSILRLGYLSSPMPLSVTRTYHKEIPGDYFMEFCRGRMSIDSTLAESIATRYQAFFGLNIPKEIFYGCSIPLDTAGSSERQEYFTRYTDGKYVYVISGWWPKFIKFYRATLGNSKLEPNQFKSQLSNLVKSDSVFKNTKLYTYENKEFYLFRGVENNLIAFNYNIEASYYEGRSEAADFGQPPPMFSDWYNIIEIAIYLDKEFMP